MDPTKTTVAIAGAGDVARYLIEELLATNLYNILLFTRASRPPFNAIPGISLYIVPYEASAIVPHLNASRASVLFSFLHSNDPNVYVTAHTELLKACQKSETCKRFVPSECGGDIDAHPDKPRFYSPTHGAFREVLKRQTEVEWTLLNGGWFMDYVLPPSKSYMKCIVPVWPVDTEKRVVVVPGTGEEPIGLTAARDLAKACVALVEAKRWEAHTYIAGEITTWNRVIEIMQKWYVGAWDVRYLNVEDIERDLVEHKDDDDPTILWKAYMDEWNYSGASAVPWDGVMAQREKYFSGVKFRTVEELLESGKVMDIV